MTTLQQLGRTLAAASWTLTLEFNRTYLIHIATLKVNDRVYQAGSRSLDSAIDAAILSHSKGEPHDQDRPTKKAQGRKAPKRNHAKIQRRGTDKNRAGSGK